MFSGVASSEGWIALEAGVYEATYTLERCLTYLKILWKSNSESTGNISLYLNDDPSPIVLDLGLTATILSDSTAGYFELKDILVYKFKIAFSEANTNRSVNYYGFY